jgi:hypothetical protein
MNSKFIKNNLVFIPKEKKDLVLGKNQMKANMKKQNPHLAKFGANSTVNHQSPSFFHVLESKMGLNSTV